MKNVVFRSAEEALETLRLATEAANLGIWDLNVDSGELHWSELTKGMFGVAGPGPLTIDDFRKRLHPDEVARVEAAMSRALTTEAGGEYDIEFRICRPSGEQRVLHAKGRAFFEGDGANRKATRFVGTLLDRTDQRLAEAALAQAEQLAATGRLAASIAHEINNPLEAVTNLLYLLREEVNSSGKEYLRQAEAELARVSEIAANTLRFYRDPKGLVLVDVSELTRSVLNLFHGRMAVRDIQMQFDCGEQMRIPAGQGELRQVLVNLVGNAIDAMPDGGCLKVRCRALRNYLGSQESGVSLTVADTGTGMSPEILRRVFEPFFTTKGSSGTGLGLWLTLEILKKYDLRLRVRSKVDHGTVFRLFLPQKPRETASGKP